MQEIPSQRCVDTTGSHPLSRASLRGAGLTKVAERNLFADRVMDKSDLTSALNAPDPLLQSSVETFNESLVFHIQAVFAGWQQKNRLCSAANGYKCAKTLPWRLRGVHTQKYLFTHRDIAPQD